MKKRACSLFLALAVMLSLTAVPAGAAESPAVSRNHSAQDYTTWSKPVNSYLFENGASGLTRVEHISGQIVVEDYSSDFQFQSSRTIPMELSLWGGFFAGEDYNFFVFGQENPSESDNTEVIRVVKYSKDWQRLGQASLHGANTTAPFEAGSLRMDEYGGYLYIRTCHEMYTSDDGLNHQANLTMAVDQSSMEVTDSYYDVMNASYGYVSHSFNQFLLVDEEGRIVALDHGDAYPRAMTFMRYYADAATGRFTDSFYQGRLCSVGEQRTFAGAVGDNVTGASVGGLAETSECYMMAYNYDGAGGSGPRNVYLQAMDVATGKGKDYQITQSGGSTTPVLAPTGLDGGYLLWNDKEGYAVNDTLYYVHYDADGVPGQIVSTTGSLSDCAPIYYNGQVVWYVTDSSAPTFYTLDEGGVSAHPTSASAQEPEPAPDPGQSPSFSDVSDGAWYAPYVNAAAGAGLMQGTGEGSFSPDQTLSVAEVVTLAARLYAEEDGESVPASDPDQSWYQGAYDYCVDSGLFTAAEVPVSSMTAPATRFEMVDLLDRAVPDSEKTPIHSEISVPDLSQSSPYGDVVYRWYQAGITQGDQDGNFNGGSQITRAETAAILCRLAGLTERV